MNTRVGQSVGLDVLPSISSCSMALLQIGTETLS